MMKHAPVTPSNGVNMGLTGRGKGGGVNFNTSQHHHVSYQITPLVTLSHTKKTECSLLYLLLPLHDQTCPKTNTLLTE